MKQILIMLLFLFLFFKTSAQEQDEDLKEELTIEKAEDEIASFFVKVSQASEDDERDAYNYEIIQLLNTVLNYKGSMDYKFTKLPKMFKEKSEDGKIRIINWNLLMGDGTFKYYGFVQYKTKDSVYLSRLREAPRDPGLLITPKLTANNWIGALYYNIICPIDSKMPYYILFAWDGTNDFINRKMVEVLSFDANKKPLFGLPVFQTETGSANRLIFEYAKRSTMVLRFEENKKLITYDHLGPFKPQYLNQPEFYGPDASIDAYIYEKGIWNYMPDIDARNSSNKIKKQKPRKTESLYNGD